MKRSALTIALVIATLHPTRVNAFSDPSAFAEAVDAGGGGGRFFTGSPQDGYTCKVCHGGGHDPELLILGLPVAGYLPSTSYEVTITWPHDSENVALEAEFTDGRGSAAGSIRVPPQAELLPAESCQPVAAGIGAATLSEVGVRTIVSVSDCGAQRMRVLWTAPAQDIGPVWMMGSVVTSNAHGDVIGDGVTDFARVLPSPSTPDALATKIDAGCRVVAGVGFPGTDAVWIVLAGLWLRRRTKRGQGHVHV